MSVLFKYTPVFTKNYHSKAGVVINQGGTSSSKTYSIIQVLYYKCIERPGTVVTVTGESIPNLRKGAYRDAETIFTNSQALQQYIESWNKSTKTIVFKNKSIMEFVSNLDEQSAKSGKRDYLFVNEAQGISWLIFWQLAIRTHVQVFLDYNPTAPFWAHENLIGTNPSTNDLTATVELIISDHRHNTFLSELEHAKIEGIKDPQLFAVYARGKTGNITGLIYPHMVRIPDEDFPWSEENFFGGLDFGYTNDPTAGVRIAHKFESVFLHELFYIPGLSPKEQKEIFEAHGFNEDKPIYAEHDVDQISQLRRLDLLVLPARKGAGSLKSGILDLQKKKVFYTASSVNIHAERIRYKWMIDTNTGKPTNVPIDQFNHLMDAARYGEYSHSFSRNPSDN